MATFSKNTFNTVKYAVARPTYPRQLFDFIFRYHEEKSVGKPRWDTAVDLGCGTGQATIQLFPFKRVIGVDPSAKMIQGAQEFVEETLQSTKASSEIESQFQFVQSPAEKLDFLQDGSADLVVAAQAAHWFNWEKLWLELARVTRKNATVAFWGYSEFRLSHYPSLAPLITAYSQGTDPASSLGPHWEQPGRRIVDNHLLEIPSASSVVPDAFHSEERVYFAGDHHPQLPSPRPVILRKKVTWEGFEDYLRSYSSLHTYHERFPEDQSRADGDIVTRFIATLKSKMDEADRASSALHPEHPQSVGGEDEVEIEWPLAVVMVKRS